MEKRLKLQALLELVLGSKNVYYQPPENVKLSYPCIIYERSSNSKNTFANDKLYNHRVRYTVTVVDKNPDSLILDRMLELQMCVYDRHFTANNLNHNVYNIYY